MSSTYSTKGRWFKATWKLISIVLILLLSLPSTSTHAAKVEEDLVSANIVFASATGRSLSADANEIISRSSALTQQEISQYFAEKSTVQEAVNSLNALGFQTLVNDDIAVAVIGPKTTFEKVFDIKLNKSFHKPKNGNNNKEIPYYRASKKPTIPRGLAKKIDSVSFPVPMDFFQTPSQDPPPLNYYHLVPDEISRILHADILKSWGITGKDVKVTMNDTGFYLHPYYASKNLKITQDAVTGDPQKDDGGHGTAIASNLFAISPAIDFTSIAMFGSSVVPLPIDPWFDNLSNPIAAFIKANNNGSQVITNSWGWSELEIIGYRYINPTWTLQEALFRTEIDIAIARGAVVIFAAGNGNMVGWPGSIPEVISVGGAYVAQDNTVTASNFASSGYSILYPLRHVPDVSGIVGQMPWGILIESPTQPHSGVDVAHAGTANPGTDTDGTTDNDGWAVISGTSSAAPQVAGVVAMIKQLKPNYDQFKIKEILQDTAYDVISGSSATGEEAGPGKDNATGYGLVNAYQAVNKADPITVAIKRGLDFQRRTQVSNGSWSYNVGITGLATLAFLNDGLTESDPTVSKAVQYLLSAVKQDGSIYTDWSHKTYETSMAVLALKATQNSNYADEIQKARDWLVSSQWDDQCLWGSVAESNWYYGGFGYGNNQRPDMSNTQFALLALDAADLPKSDATWTKAVKFVSRSQNRQATNDGFSPYNDGGFLYHPGSCLSPGCASYGGATGAGMWGLALSGIAPNDGRFDAALDWVADNYSWDYNPLTDSSWGDNSLYYYYLSMSKALSMARKTRIGGFLGIGSHDWYDELSEKIVSLQKYDGSWANTNSWLYENIPQLATSYSILALQTRQLPKNADLEMVIILHSPADLHLYDDYGSHVGKNYGSGGIDTEIFGSSYSPNDPQTISIRPPEAGNYYLELIGTGEGDWQIEIIGYQDDIEVSYDSYTGSIVLGVVLSTSLNVGAFEGALTIFSSQPVSAPVMSVTPQSLDLTGAPGETLDTTFRVEETGNSEAIKAISVIANDLIDGSGNLLPSSNISFDPATFDLPVGANQDVLVMVSVPNDQPGGIYRGAINVESLNAGTKLVQLSVSVDAETNQPPVLDPIEEQIVQYSDWLSFTVSATDPNDPGNTLIFSAADLPNDLTFQDNGDGTATISGIADVAPDTYVAQITVTDPDGLSDTKPVNIVVSEEDARATYTGPMLVSTTSITSSTATVPLRATIQDITAVDPIGDPYPGNITNATVSFVNRDTSTVLCTANVILLDPADQTLGTATCDWSVDIGASNGLDYTIGIVVGGYYTRNATEDDTVVVVSKPVSNFITGGGYFINQISGGTYAGDTDAKTNFGLTIKFTRRLTNLQGRVTIIVRQDGRVYQIKTNALSSLVTIPYDPARLRTGTAELIGKANVTDVTDPLFPIVLEGNATLNVVMKDNGEPGNADLINLSLWSRNGDLLFSSNWDGVQTIPQMLDGGNLNVK